VSLPQTKMCATHAKTTTPKSHNITCNLTACFCSANVDCEMAAAAPAATAPPPTSALVSGSISLCNTRWAPSSVGPGGGFVGEAADWGWGWGCGCRLRASVELLAHVAPSCWTSSKEYGSVTTSHTWLVGRVLSARAEDQEQKDERGRGGSAQGTSGREGRSEQ
jgi:hypothetical protein